MNGVYRTRTEPSRIWNRGRRSRIQFDDFLGSQRDAHCSNIIVKLLRLTRANNDAGDHSLREQPCQSDLRDTRVFRLANFAQALDQLESGLLVMWKQIKSR